MAQTPLVEERVQVDRVVLSLESVGLTGDQFFRLCSDNRDLRLELTARKELIIMPLPGPETSRRNAIITTELSIWGEKRRDRDRLGLRLPVYPAPPRTLGRIERG